jgi:hypothetical protein
MQRWRQRRAHATRGCRGEADRCTIAYQAPCCKIVQPGLICDNTHRPGRRHTCAEMVWTTTSVHMCDLGHSRAACSYQLQAVPVSFYPNVLDRGNPVLSPKYPRFTPEIPLKFLPGPYTW